MIKAWLSKPFPYIESLRNQLFISIAAGVVVTTSLLVFQPFGIDAVATDIFWHISIFGLIATVVIFLNLVFLPVMIPRFVNAESWTIAKNLFFIFWVLLLISLCNFGYGQYLSGSVYTEVLEQNDRMGILSWMFMTVSIGTFPVFLIIYFAEKQLLFANQRLARAVTAGLLHSRPVVAGVVISLETGKSSFVEVNSEEILCVRAEGGNYLTVYWQNDLGNHSELVRMTLANFLNRVEKSKDFVRCHKSYIVNLEKVETVNGNARSLILELTGLDFTVPVSRSFPRERLIRDS